MTSTNLANALAASEAPEAAVAIYRSVARRDRQHPQRAVVK